MTIRIFTSATVVALSLAFAVAAAEQTAGSLTITESWARATPPKAPTGGGYLTITNTGKEADTLVAASSPTAKTVQIHLMEVKDGVMSMHEIEGGLTISPGETVALAPGGSHIMFMGLNQPLVEGDMVPVTLTFEKSGDVEIQLPIQPIGAKEPPAMTRDHGEMMHDHGDQQ